MNLAVVALTPRGAEVARRLQASQPGSDLFLLQKLQGEGADARYFGRLGELVPRLFGEYRGLVFIMALGIAVRAIAPHIQDKRQDPAVVVVDEGGHFAISLLSGHEGGANALAVEVANALGAEPVITTASENQKPLTLGLGSRKGVDAQAVRQAIEQALEAAGRHLEEVRWAATIDLKAREPGIVAACRELGLSLRVIPRQAVKGLSGGFQPSPRVKKWIGVEGVCEPCALLAGRNARLILPKKALNGVTVAIAEESST